MGGEWPKVAVAEVCDVYLGGTPKRSDPSYWGGSIKWATAKDIAGCATRYLVSTEETITKKGIKESAAKILDKDTIVITARGTVGALCMLGESMSFNQTCYGLVGKKNKITQHYLYYALKAAISQMHSLSYGTVFNTITMKTFEDIEICLPPLPEQHAIAHILGTLDDKIELNRKMSQTLEAMAQAIFKSWFVDFDPIIDNALKAGKPIPDSLAKRAAKRKQVLEKVRQNHYPPLPKEIADLFPDEFEDSEIGEIPKGWVAKGLDEVAEFLNGLALQKYPPGNGPTLPVIKIAQIRKGDTKEADRCNTNVPNEYLVDDGDVIFSWSGSLECVLWTGGQGALNQHLFKVTSSKYPKWFYYFWIHEHLPVFRNIAADKATTMGHIQRRHLSDAKVLIADELVMRVAHNLFVPFIDEIIQLRVESGTLTSIREALLPKLISGELRVPDAEKFVGDVL